MLQIRNTPIGKGCFLYVFYLGKDAMASSLCLRFKFCVVFVATFIDSNVSFFILIFHVYFYTAFVLSPTQHTDFYGAYGATLVVYQCLYTYFYISSYYSHTHNTQRLLFCIFKLSQIFLHRFRSATHRFFGAFLYQIQIFLH